MSDSLQNNLNRPQRYWYVDGLAEMAGGAVIFLLGALYAIAGLLPQGLARGFLLGIGQPMIILGAAWLTRSMVRSLKERLTYPRTGYVQYQQPTGSKRWARILLVAFVACTISVLTVLLGHGLPESILPFFTGAMLALAIGYLGARIGLRRFYAVAAFSLILGALISWQNPPAPWPYALLFGLEGLAWMACGALVLAHYLRTTRPLDAEELDE